MMKLHINSFMSFLVRLFKKMCHKVNKSLPLLAVVMLRRFMKRPC